MSQPPDKGRVIVFGIMFFYPLAGVTYQFLHYMLGLKRLGFDVYYVEDTARRVYDPALNDMSDDASANIAAVSPALERYGFADKWAFRGLYDKSQMFGMDEASLDALYASADACLNVTGGQEMREEHLRIPNRIYVESDPFASQVRTAQGDEYWLSHLDSHTHHFSFGENLGQPDCLAPMGRYDWKPTRQPVALDLWDDGGDVGGQAYTTVTTWSNKGNDVEWEGEKYLWTKNFNFERMMGLPARCEAQFDIAVKAPEPIVVKLKACGWNVIDSAAVSRGVDGYRQFIQQSRGEFTVARDQYVRPRTGWSSDRSVCYLAAGRPVVTQDTGFGRFLPTGEGLFGFQTLEDAAAAIEVIESDYPRHCRAAREISREYLCAEKVVGSVMSRAGLM